MIAAVAPSDEAERLRELEALQILDTPAEERFDRLTRLAQRLFDMPIAMVSLVDAERQWSKSAQGTTVRESPRPVSFCGHAILSSEPLVVRDAARDPRFSDNPLVTGEPHIRFYAAYPLKGPGGRVVGTLCLVDHRPRQLSGEEVESLRDLGHLVEEEFRHMGLNPVQRETAAAEAPVKRRNLIDPLTSMWSREAILGILRREIKAARRTGRPVAAVVVDLDAFGEFRNEHGAKAGDALLKEAAARIRLGLRGGDAIGRWGAGQFLPIVTDADVPRAALAAERVREFIRSGSIRTPEGEARVTASIGVAATDGEADSSAEAVVGRAMEALARAKQAGGNRVVKM